MRRMEAAIEFAEDAVVRNQRRLTFLEKYQ